jgi:hypothetical protein
MELEEMVQRVAEALKPVLDETFAFVMVIGKTDDLNRTHVNQVATLSNIDRADEKNFLDCYLKGTIRGTN